MSRVATLLAKDMRVISRDPMMAPLAFIPLLTAVIMRWAAGFFSLEHLDIYLAPAVVFIAPTMLAAIFGFALIEEREQQTWLLLRVIPLRQSTLLGYVVVTSSGFSFAVSLLAALIYGLPVVHWPSFLALTAVASLTAPLVALALGSLASNKIEGFALSKLMGNAPTLSALVFVLSPAWQLVLAWNPFYWLYLGLLRAYAGESAIAELAVDFPTYPDWMYFAVPTLLCTLGIWWLGGSYRRRAG